MQSWLAEATWRQMIFAALARRLSSAQMAPERRYWLCWRLGWQAWWQLGWQLGCCLGLVLRLHNRMRM